MTLSVPIKTMSEVIPPSFGVRVKVRSADVNGREDEKLLRALKFDISRFFLAICDQPAFMGVEELIDLPL